MPKVPERLYSRPPIERMMLIHERIKSGKYPNCNQLAKEIEVASRTIKRDVDFMKYRMDLPIEYDSQRYGFYYTKAVDQFPGIQVSEAEIFSLLVAQKAIAQYHGTPFEKPLKQAFARLTMNLSQNTAYLLENLDQAISFRPLAPEDADWKRFEIVSQALQEHRVMEFDYRNLGAQAVQVRKVRPYHLGCVDNRWYLFAFDLGRNAIRTFSLSRLTKPKLLKQTFKLPADFDPKEYLKGSFSVFKGEQDFNIVILFDPWAADLVRDRPWHAGQELIELPGGHVRLKLRLNNIEEVEGWVLSWGVHAQVIEPEALRERIRAAAQKLTAMYEPAAVDQPKRSRGQRRLFKQKQTYVPRNAAGKP